MKNQIIPSIIASNQQELDARLKKVTGVTGFVQLDVMDGKFVPSKSLMFDFCLPKRIRCEAHLMIKNPEIWAFNHLNCVDCFIFHFESVKEPRKFIEFCRRHGKKVGIAIRPETELKKIYNYLGDIDKLVILTVRPGRYGAKFLPDNLMKVVQLRKKSRIDIEIDGGVNLETIELCKQAGANQFVVGSYLQKARNVKLAFRNLKKLI